MREQVLAMLGKYMPGSLKPSGENQIITTCPFHKDGQERKPSFSVNVEKGLFHCFTCHEKGSIRTLLQKLSVPASTIDAETKSLEPYLERQRALQQVEKKHKFVNREPFKANIILPESILGVYEVCPTKLVQDGFREDILKRMDVGYDRTNHRIMYPLRDMFGNLAGFSGGITEFTQQHLHQKYRVYQGKHKGLDGKTIPSDFGTWFDEDADFAGYRCENHDYLWNFHRLWARRMSDPAGTVFLVEGFKACLWMMQSGFENTVALMGSYISDKQQQMLHLLGWDVVLFLDNDAAGIRATGMVGDLLWKPMHGKVSVVPYPAGDFETQPDDYEESAVPELVSKKMTFLKYINQGAAHGND
jgi:DNA primase